MEHDPAVRAIRAWYRLELATGRFRQELRRRHGITGEQLAILRIVAERPEWLLADLRGRLTMHPATLGQTVDRLARRDLVAVDSDAADRRRRVVSITGSGRSLLAQVPLAGPVRLRTTNAEPDRLKRLEEAFEDAVALFGLEEWA